MIESYKKVAIIGAGAAGLITADSLISKNKLSNDNKLFDITIYEKSNTIGGVWRYNPSDNNIKTRPMYPSLRTNLPKEIMAFNEGNPFNNDNKISFIKYNDVYNYLDEFTIRKGLYKYIKFNTLVDKITWNIDNNQWLIRSSSRDGNNQLDSDECYYDSVIICNGHFNKPLIPDIPGVEYLNDKSIHSISYDGNDKYKDLVVLVVGTRSSGSDMAREISLLAKQVYVSCRKPPDSYINIYNNIIIKPQINRINDDGSINFIDETTINVDVVLWCTGYCYEYPFLDSTSNIIVKQNKAVTSLYIHIFNINNPSLAFIGLPYSIVPFPLFYIQSMYLSAVLSNEITLPSIDEQIVWLKDYEASTSSIEQYHNLGGKLQFQYIRQLAQLIGLLDERLDSYINMIEQIYFDNSNYKPSYPGAPDSYRDRVYTVNSNNFTWSVS